MKRRGVLARAAAVALALGVAATRADAGPSPLRADGISLAADDSGTRIVLTLSAAATPEVYSLEGPPRLVIDLPPVDWRIDAPAGAGLAARVRFGLAAPGRSRLVVDLAGPARVAAIAITPLASGAALSLTLAAAPGPDPTGATQPRGGPGGRAAAGLVVALDPGHGGADPGAVEGDMVEKTITLAFAQALAEALETAGHRVVMTRTQDVYVSLRERVARARDGGADVLLSLHADAAPQARVAGASVYTLSQQASDAAAMAAGTSAAAVTLAAMFPGLESDVARALAPAIRRRTSAGSARLGATLLDALAAQTPVLPGRPLRAAAFQVLRAPDVASALIELGFLSNAQDRARLADPAWRAAVAAVIAAALERWADTEAPHRAVE